MKVRINGETVAVTVGRTLGDFLRQKGIEADSVVVELNRSIVAREALDTVMFMEDDCVEIVRFVGGG